MSSKYLNKADEIDRRRFLLNAAKSYLGVATAPMIGASLASPAMAQAAAAATGGGKAEHVIFLNMDGGMSQIDTFDVKPGSEYQGPVEAINTTGDFQISQFLPNTAKMGDKLCLINSMTSTQGVHDQAQYQLHSSYAPLATITHPSIGSWALRMKGRMNQELPGYVAVGGRPKNGSSGFMGIEYGAVRLGNANEGLKNSEMANGITEEDFEKRLAVADALNQRFHQRYKVPQVKAYESLYDEAVKLMKSEDLKAFDLHHESSETRALYGKGSFAQGCLLSRRLVEAGVRYIEVTLGGWDSHYDNFGSVERRCQDLDQAYAALLKDLEAKGLLEKTLVVLSTEFGRTPWINAKRNDGRDHHPSCFSSVIAGGGVKGGYQYGTSTKDGRRPETNPVTHQDLNATIGYALGIDLNQVIHSPSGRPFRMAGPDKLLGKPMTSAFG